MIKKQNIIILTILAVLITVIAVFLKPQLNRKILNDNLEEKITQNADDYYTYNGEYFSVDYPENWENISDSPNGNDRSLEPFLIRSYHPEPDLDLKTRIRISLSDISPEMKDIFESTKNIKKNSEISTVYFDISSDQKVLGFPAVIITQRLKPRFEHEIQFSANFSKRIMFDRNNIRYMISYNSSAPTEEILETLIQKDLPVLEQVLNSLEFK